MAKAKGNINKKQGIRLSEFRKDKNITQEKLAELSNYSVQTISGIENGSRRMTLESASIFAKTLGVRTEYLMCEDDYPTPMDIFHERVDTERGKKSLIDDIFKLLYYQVEYAKSESTYKVLREEYDIISASDDNVPPIFHPDNPDTFNDLVILTDHNLNKHTVSHESYVALKKEVIEFAEFKLQKLMKEDELNEDVWSTSAPANRILDSYK